MTDQEMYDHINEWAKFMRRDDDSIFSALFHDKEDVSTDEVEKFVSDTAKFFDLPLPHVHNSCETLAKIVSYSDAKYAVFYDWEKLSKVGINNKAAFKLLLTHELCHHVFKKARFGFCRNESWNQELMSDFVAGIRSIMNFIPCGKYKYAIGTTKASLTHPPGYYRKGLFDLGRQSGEEWYKSGKSFNIHDVVDAFCEIMEVNKNNLNKVWMDFVKNSDFKEPKPKVTPVEDLPDNNLVKMYIMKKRKEEEERRKQQQETEG